MAIGRSENGRIERQKILDAMHRFGRPATCREICEAVGQSRVSTTSRLGQMRTHGEADAVDGAVGNIPTVFYTPLVRETAAIFIPGKRQPRVCEPRFRAHPLAAETAEVTVRRPGYVRHNGMNRDRPLPDQGGQGSTGHSGPHTATYLEQNV